MTDLVPLRVEGGWFVQHNELRELNPSQLLPNDERWSLLTDDLIRLVRDELLVDVGWYPDQDPSGEYGITVISEEDWDRPIAEFVTRSLRELVAKLEEMLWIPPPIPSERLLERLVGGVSERRGRAADELARRGDVRALDAISAALVRETIPVAIERLQRARDRLLALRISQGVVTELQRIGFFRELKHGKPDGPVLRESMRDVAGPDDAPLVAYLQSGVALMTAPGVVRDVLAPEAGIIGSLSILTDGMFAWPSDLAHYVARHHAVVPDRFVEHAKTNGWKVPAPLDLTQLKLP